MIGTLPMCAGNLVEVGEMPTPPTTPTTVTTPPATPPPTTPTIPKFYAAGYGGTIDLYTVSNANKLVRGPGVAANSSGTGVSWLTYDGNSNLIYSNDEVSPGNVFVHGVAQDGSLQLQGAGVSSGGDGPVCLVLAQGYLFVANYTSGTAAALQVTQDGVLQTPPAQNIVQFTRQGTGPVASRQDHSYAHQATFSPDSTFLYVVDLGADAIHRLKMNSSGLKLMGDTNVPSGSGPRHLAFYGGYAYLASELNNTVSAFSVDTITGDLLPIGDVLSPVPAGTSIVGRSTAEIAVDPLGAFVYVSNRGDSVEDHISIFSRNPTDGTLKFNGWVLSGGLTPRHFSLSLDKQAQYLVVGNQLSENIVLFARDATTGNLMKLDIYPSAGQVAYTGFAPF